MTGAMQGPVVGSIASSGGSGQQGGSGSPVDSASGLGSGSTQPPAGSGSTPTLDAGASLPDGGCEFLPDASALALAACCTGSAPDAGVCCKASDCSVGQRCLQHACQSVTCNSVQDGTYYVDPLAGIDDPTSTGTMNCPVRTLARAFALIGSNGDAGARATVAIVNDGVAPVIGEVSGEVFPLQPPANVTITALDPTKNLPIVLNMQAPPPSPPTLHPTSFVIAQPGVVISSLVIEGNFNTEGISPGPDTGVDHVALRNLSTGIDVEGTSLGDGGFAYISMSIGPGVVVQGCETGLSAGGRNTITIRGGRGADHTSFSGNSVGVLIHDQIALNIEGADIDPAYPDESDVDTDNNRSAGLEIGLIGRPDDPLSSVRGLHSSHNPIGAWLSACDHLKMRASYLGDDQQAGVLISYTAAGGGCANEDNLTWLLDLGNLASGDPGRNVFAAGPDAGSSICIELPNGAPNVLAAGNIFGSRDCASGGTLRISPSCSGQVDVGGVSPDAGTLIDLNNCQ